MYYVLLEGLRLDNRVNKLTLLIWRCCNLIMKYLKSPFVIIKLGCIIYHKKVEKKKES